MALHRVAYEAQRQQSVTALVVGDACSAYALYDRTNGPTLIVAWADGIVQRIADDVVDQGHAITALAIDNDVQLCHASRAGAVARQLDAASDGDGAFVCDVIDGDAEFVAWDGSGTMLALGVGRRIDVVRWFGGVADVLARLEGHRGRVTAAAFHAADAHLLTSTSEDRTFKVWDLRERQVLYQSTVLCASPLVALAVHPLERRLAVAAADGRVWVFQEDSQRQYKEAQAFQVPPKLPPRSTNEGRHSPLKDVVINSEPAWRRPPRVAADAEEEEGNASETPLALEFVTNDKCSRDVIVAVTCTKVYRIDVVSKEVLAIIDLAANDVGTAAYASLSRKAGRVGVAAAFEPLVFVGTVDAADILPAVPPALLQQTPPPRPPDAVSFFPRGSLPSNSPLVSEDIRTVRIKPKEVLSYEAFNKATRPASGSRVSRGDQPILFHSRIKSSGYGAEIKAKSSKDFAATKKKQPLPRAMAYPLGCGVLNQHQPQHDYSATTDGNVMSAVVSLACSADAKNLAVATTNGPAFILRLPVAKCKGAMAILGRAAPYCGTRVALDFSHDSRYLLTAGLSDTLEGKSAVGRVQIWPAAGTGGRCVDVPLLTMKRDSNTARWFYLDRFVAVAVPGAVQLHAYALGDGGPGSSRLVHEWQLEANGVHALGCVNSELSPLVIAAASNRSIYVLDAGTATTLRTIRDAHGKPAHSLALPVPSSATANVPQHAYDVFASASTDGSIALWDLRQDKCAARFTAHTNRREPVGISFSPCMRYLASGSEDKSAYIFDLRTAAPVARLRGHNDACSSVAFNPLFPQLATASYDGKIRFYTAPY
ncbi:WD40-repeat-containing domain protein [Pelagophyceae sp. CCMP2097]|nr:WD40-repeat-containing domain protein [Pelagophyceae sp. CCMP2097]